MTNFIQFGIIKEILNEVLSCGEWIVDNNQTTEQQVLNRKVAYRSSQTNSQDGIASSLPQFKPIKSYRDETLSLSVSVFF